MHCLPFFIFQLLWWPGNRDLCFLNGSPFFNSCLTKNILNTLTNLYMTLNNPKISSKTQNQFETKKLLEFKFVILGKVKSKKHLG